MMPSELQTPDGTGSAPPEQVPMIDTAKRKPRSPRRIPKSDAVLEAAVDRALQGILEIAPEAQVGRHVSAVVDGERLVTHRFEAFLPGYGGWQWYASLARVPRGKDVSVCEVGLLPSETSLRAPEWLPWSERVRPEDHETEDAPAAPAAPATEVVPRAEDDGAEQPPTP